MNTVIRRTRYFRLLELCALLAAIALIGFTGNAMKWVGFSRMFGMYLGVFFGPIAFLELLAAVSERYWADRLLSKSTLAASAVWTLVMVLPITLIITQSPLQYQTTLTSEFIWRQFPDSFPSLLNGSALVVACWLMPIGILSGFLQVVKRIREEQMRHAMIFWQCSFLVVIAWCVLFNLKVDSRLVHVATMYFSPTQVFHLGEATDSPEPFDIVLVLLFWCVLFVALKYAVKYFGVRSSLAGFLTSGFVGTALIFVPGIPALPEKTFVDFINYSGWYSYRLPHLVPLRIWPASLVLMGGTVVMAGLVWLLRREKSTLQSG